MKTLPLCLLACLCVSTLRAQTPEEANIRLDFPDKPVADVLRYYSTLLHKQVVCDNSVQGSVTLQTNGNVTGEQAMRLIEEALFLNGFSLVDAEDGSLVKVIGLGKVPRAEGVPVFTSLDDLPKHERVISYVVHLKQANPQQMAGALGSYVPPSAVNGFTAGPGGTVIITARTSMVRSLAKVADIFDVPTPEGDVPRPPRRPLIAPPVRPAGE